MRDPASMALSEPGMVLYLADGTIQACNSRAEEILGLKFEEMGGWTATNFFGQAIHENGSPLPGESHPVGVTLQTGKPCVNVVMGLYRAVDELIWLLVDTQPLKGSQERRDISRLYRSQKFAVDVENKLVPYGVIVTFQELAEDRAKFGQCDRVAAAKERHRAISYTQQQSDRHLRTILDSLLNFALVLTPSGILIEANRTALEAATLKPEEVLNQPFEETYWWSYNPEVQAQLREAIQQAANGKKVRYDAQVRVGENKFIIIDFTIVPILDDAGQVTYLISSGIDITERKQAEAALRDSEEFNRSIFENSADCVKVLDADGHLISMNGPGMCLMEIDDLTPFYGQSWLDFWEEPYRSAVREAIAVAKTGEIGHFEGLCPTRKGTPKWWDVLVAAVWDQNGQIKHLVSASRDITANKQAEAALKATEAKLKSFVDSNVIGVVLSDIHGGIQEANDKFLEMLGYSREDLNTGKMRWMEMTPPEFLHRDERHIAEAQLNGSCTPYEKEYFHQDGRRIPVLIGYALVGETHEEAVVFVIDLTERKRIEAERDRLFAQEKAARAEAERANRIKDEFLAVLSHELRTPLNPILGWSKLLQRGRLEPTKAAAAFTIIERNARLQAQLIEDLLDVSRILQGKLSLNISQVKPKLVVLGALDTVRLAAEAKGIEIQTQLEDNLGSVWGDPSRLQQVVWNLLSNAVKFTPKGGRVEVRLTQDDSYVQIQVIDTGKGISPDFLPYVFDYFRQADSATTRQFGGLGLGLAIVRQIVELHGGTVGAESLGEERGATFTVMLPLQRSENRVKELQRDQDLPLAPNYASSPLAGLHVLVVDDEADSREIVAFILEQEGAKITSVASAPEALQILAHSPVDVLVSDIGMPEMDGYMLLRQVRALPPEEGGEIPAIALTAYAGEYDRSRAIAAGFQQHLSKPVEPNEVINIVMRLKVDVQRQD